MQMLFALVFFPAAAALMVLAVPSKQVTYLLSGLLTLILGAVAILLYSSSQVLYFDLNHSVELLVVAADVALLLYFVFQGLKFSAPAVTVLAVVQLLLFGWAESILPFSETAPVIVDELSKFMFLIINIVGGIIVLYAVKYMSYEQVEPFKKRLFVAYLMLFLSVMNAIVVANSLLLFFFLFEMTTLASYLLIAFRNDETSRANALRALWMNQIGGVVILLGSLVAIYGFETVMFSDLLAKEGGLLLLGVALVAMAALVKGASIPFDGWLLGAMVAPTPVSAMLHSATMVKIAPYLLLKLAPAVGATLLGGLLSLFGALVFVAASYLALSRSPLKEILGYSTIALLGLMMALAAIGTEESMTLAMVLVFFHALSKALLFLTAGVIERTEHVKSIDEMKGLVHRAPKSVGYMMFGFISLTLPPFGLFLGKLFAITSVASLLEQRPWLIVVLLGVIVGSVLLVLLYFKVASALLSRPSDIVRTEGETMPFGFSLPLMLLTLLTIVSAVGFIVLQSDALLSLFALPLLFVAFLPWLVRSMERFDRVAPYHCAEKGVFDAALVYFEPSVKVKSAIYWGFGILFAAVAAGGALS
ncbi:MAG: proton-conducting transporter membrane subunit [Sulfurimonadaceae bacterium]|nr:proton-conducting transporter membrane subunit [Sulfurimonadaceae bacterium]